MTNPSLGPFDIEKTNLEAHVDICAQRYNNLDQRMSRIESKVIDLQTAIEDSHHSMVKVVIATAGTVITGVLSVLVVLLTKSI